MRRWHHPVFGTSLTNHCSSEYLTFSLCSAKLYSDQSPEACWPLLHFPPLHCSHSPLSVYFTAQSPDQLYQIEQEAIRLSEEIKAEYWAVSAKSGGSQTHKETLISHHPTQLFYPIFVPLNSFLCLFLVPGDGVRDFFFRVASLTFEANVLSELEKSGSRHVGDIISESVFSVKSHY